MKQTEAQLRASKKYLAKFEEIRIRLKAEDKQSIVEYAASKGESVNAFLIRAARETMERDTAETGNYDEMENSITRSEALKALDELFEQTADIPKMSLEEINAEISAARNARNAADN